MLWLRDLVDECETEVLKVWKGSDGQFAAKSNCDYDVMERDEQPLGEIEVELEFQWGLSG